jgi:hypothetical protein
VNGGTAQLANVGTSLSSVTTATTLLVVQVIYGGTNGSNSTVKLYIDQPSPTTPNLTLTGQNLSTNAIGSEVMFAGGETTGTVKTTADFGELNVGTSYTGVV